jgi:hypothetical protein
MSLVSERLCKPDFLGLSVYSELHTRPVKLYRTVVGPHGGQILSAPGTGERDQFVAHGIEN